MYWLMPVNAENGTLLFQCVSLSVTGYNSLIGKAKPPREQLGTMVRRGAGRAWEMLQAGLRVPRQVGGLPSLVRCTSRLTA